MIQKPLEKVSDLKLLKIVGTVAIRLPYITSY